MSKLLYYEFENKAVKLFEFENGVPSVKFKFDVEGYTVGDITSKLKKVLKNTSDEYQLLPFRYAMCKQSQTMFTFIDDENGFLIYNPLDEMYEEAAKDNYDIVIVNGFLKI